MSSRLDEARVHEGDRTRIFRFAGGPFQENGYVVECRSTGALAIVDPGHTAPRMLEAFGDRLDRVEAIWLTHAHLDHVEGLPRIVEDVAAPVYLHADDLPLYRAVGEQARAFGLPDPGDLPPIDRSFEAGGTVSLGEVPFEVRHAPGHAPGHVILHQVDDRVALVADVIFQRGIGRTDLPGGSMQQLMTSIRDQVLTLPDDTVLWTGHGPSTTVGDERMGNPFLISQARPTRGKRA